MDPFEVVQVLLKFAAQNFCMNLPKHKGLKLPQVIVL